MILFVDCNNRPISLLSTFSKILERLMYKRLNDLLQTYELLNEYQFGFRKNNSTLHSLIQITEKIKTSIESGKSKVADNIFDIFKSGRSKITISCINRIFPPQFHYIFVVPSNQTNNNIQSRTSTNGKLFIHFARTTHYYGLTLIKIIGAWLCYVTNRHGRDVTSLMNSAS